MAGNGPEKQRLGQGMARGRQTDDISYTEGVRRYCGEKISSNAWTEKTAAEYASTFDLVRQILRHNPAMRAIGDRQANSIKGTCSSLPPNMTKGIYSGKTVRQVLRMNPTKALDRLCDSILAASHSRPLLHLVIH